MTVPTFSKGQRQFALRPPAASMTLRLARRLCSASLLSAAKIDFALISPLTFPYCLPDTDQLGLHPHFRPSHRSGRKHITTNARVTVPFSRCPGFVYMCKTIDVNWSKIVDAAPPCRLLKTLHMGGLMSIS